jgi:hypothetical protein
MFFNNKSQSNIADSELLVSDDSFMIELQPTDLAQISGGYGHGGCYKPKHKKEDYKEDYKEDHKEDYKEDHKPVSYCPPVYCPPVYCPPKKSYC